MTFLRQAFISSRNHLHLTRPTILRPSFPVGRHFSAESPQEKLHAIIEDYREKNYTQELPSRFAKEMAKAADVDKDGFISVGEAEKLLENIGAKDRLSRVEVATIMDEIGKKQGEKGVPIQDVINYLSKKS